VCAHIIDGGCTNVASATLIDKLQLPTKVHATPYSPKWLKQGSEVLCDVHPIDDHLLLGSP